MKAKSKSALKLTVIAIAMFGFGFLLVPLYDAICDITGLNGKTGTIVSAADAPANTASKRATNTTANGAPIVDSVKVEFIAHVDPAMQWSFAPEQTVLQAKPGQYHDIHYLTKNNTEQAGYVQAVPSVVPTRAAAYVKKLECFCFDKQHFSAGEERKLLAKLMIDENIPSDIKQITLNYTLFQAPKQAV